MGILLYRVDERLIHGQVTLGWGARLHPTRYVVVDDHLAEDAWESELIRLGTPFEATSDFFSVDEARGRLPEWRSGEERIFLLTRAIDPMLRLARDRALAGESVNLGGIHHGPGRVEVLPYLFLDPADRDGVRALMEVGVRVFAQDLPTAPQVPAERLLDV